MMKKQVRAVDQTAYPHVLWPLRWTIAHNTWMVPLLCFEVGRSLEQSLTHTTGLYGNIAIRKEEV